jgi:Hemerythrin HHE cation binding domain
VRELVAAERGEPGSGPRTAGNTGMLDTDGGRAPGGATLAAGSAVGVGHETRKVRLWDETTRPVTPSAPAAHAYSGTGKAIGRHLADVHDHLRRELSQVRDLLGQVKRGSVTIAGARAALNEMTLRQNNWTLGAYCAAYCTMLTQHHGIEDRADFPHLRRADPRLGPVIDRLEQEHVIIHEVVPGVDQALVDLVSKPDDFSRLQDRVDLLTEALESHLSYAERQITEPLTRFGFYPGQL